MTTEAEIESFNIIRGMLADTVPIDLDTRKKQLLIPDENKKFIRFYIESLNDLYKYKDKLIEVLNRYLVR